MQDEELANDVARLLDGRAIATAESCTAGRIAEVLACVDKATEFLRGGVVAYQEEVKRTVLGVTAESVLSNEAAEEMAVGAAALLDAPVVVATTGVAGENSEEDTPPGTVYIGMSVDGTVTSTVHRFEGSPQQICDQARRQALLDLSAALADR